MRILVISHSCVIATNQLLFERLASMTGVKIDLLVPSSWKSEYTGKKFKAERLAESTLTVHTHPVRFRGHLSLHHYKGGLRRLIRRLQPDAVFLDEEPWSLAAAQAVSACRHESIPLICYTKQNVQKRYPPPFHWIEKRTHRHAASIAAVSGAAKRVLREKGYSGPCPVLAHGFDATSFHPGEEPELCCKLGLRGVVIGYVGRFVPVKGLETLLDATALLAAQANSPESFTILLVGGGPLEPELREQTKRLGIERHVVFTGPVAHESVAAYLRCMQVMVLPSITLPHAQEQFGRVLIEAQGCGVPTVGSTSGNIPLLIKQTGGGLTFEEKNAKDLACKLHQLISEPELRTQLSAKAHRNALAQFSLEAVATKLHGILLSAAGVASQACCNAAAALAIAGQDCDLLVNQVS